MSTACDSYLSALQSRRNLFKVAGLGLLGTLVGPAISQLSVRPKRQEGPVLVSVFLRGGMDGMTAVVPHGEDAYYRLRPGLGVARKDTLPLSDFFGLHQTLKPIHKYYEAGELAILHAVGSQDRSRSHFEAMNAMESGAAKAGTGTASGWLARHLQATTTPETTSPVRGVSIGSTMQDSLRGAPGVQAIESLDQYRLQAADSTFKTALSELYASGEDAYSQAGRGTLEVLRLIEDVNHKGGAKVQNGYPTTGFGQALRQVAFLIKAGIGLEVAAVDFDGWDSHVAQQPLIERNLTELATALDAFQQDLGALRAKVTTVVQTEFGRRAAENSGLGTDHGRASAMFVLGGGVRGGRVLGPWPGLRHDQLEDELDLRVATDYRQPLAEVLRHHHGEPAKVFAGFEAEPLGLFA